MPSFRSCSYFWYAFQPFLSTVSFFNVILPVLTTFGVKRTASSLVAQRRTFLPSSQVQYHHHHRRHSFTLVVQNDQAKAKRICVFPLFSFTAVCFFLCWFAAFFLSFFGNVHLLPRTGETATTRTAVNLSAHERTRAPSCHSRTLRPPSPRNKRIKRRKETPLTYTHTHTFTL